MVTLYLTRHGETEGNVSHIMQGQTQGRLTANGRRQARVVACQMAGEGIDVYMSSDLRRAIETCEIIAGEDRKDAIVTTPLLRERDWGAFTGRYIPDLKDEKWPDDVETLEALKSRAADFLALIRHDYDGKRVLAVGHGIINKAIQAVLLSKEMQEIPPMKNAEIRIYSV